ncbi:unnamed protein product [Cylicocyclus nassatus]|uniref:Uncharacterized protein n=1 Tax=Cylicocyclus nassatus TaxID=53992 RepID=A0AA36GW73_CYLNA|nr:unnamed protein product [Cylicocyclus nassatus]
MRLAAYLHVNYEEDDLLPLLIVVFNLIPITIFLAVLSFTIVINFGIAFIVEMIALLLCLAWLIPCVIICTVSALVLWQAIQVSRFIIGAYIDRSLSGSIPPNKVH